MNNPPQLFNIDAERALLGSLIIDPAAWRAVRALVAPGDFYRETNKWVYQALAQLVGNGEDVDMVTLSDALERAGRLEEVGGLAALSELCASVPTAMHAESYAETVREYARRRALRRIGEEIARMAAAPDAIGDVEVRARNLVGSLTSLGAGRHLVPLRDATAEMIEQLERMEAGQAAPTIPFPLSGLTRILGGMHPAEQTVLAARPSVGKTSLAVEIALRAAEEGATVAVFSLEMSRKAIGARALARLSGVSLSTMRRGPVEDHDLRAALDAHERMSTRIHIDTTPALTAAEIEARAEALRTREGALDLIVVDYLQLMKISDAHRGESAQRVGVGENAKRMRELARDLGCHSLLLSQITRAGVDRPGMAHLKESGTIEEVADNVVILHNPSLADPQQPATLRDIIVAKGRNDGTGLVAAHMEGATGEWRDLDATPYRASASRVTEVEW